MMLLLPAKKGTCPMCATEHTPETPHNQPSLFYQMRFYGIHKRWATWADAVAHCDEQIKSDWEQVLRDRGLWSEPKDGEPIAEPVEETAKPTA